MKNQDILKFVGDQKKDYNFKLVGFALETANEIENAKPEDLEAGCNVLLHAILQIDGTQL